MRVFFWTCSFVFCFSLVAQDYYNDAALWLSIDVEKRISNKFAIHVKQKDRFDYNFSRFERGYIDLGLIVKLSKTMRLRADYIYTAKKRKDDSFGNRHRASVAFVFKKDWRRWRFLYRNLLLVKYYNLFLDEDGYIPRFFDRNKFVIKYEVTKRVGFYVAQEFYIPLNSPRVKGFDRSRSYAGVTYKLTQDQDISFYFLYRAELQKNWWFRQKNSYPDGRLTRDYVYGISYNISF